MNFWNPIENAKEAFKEFLAQIASDFAGAAVDFVGDYITQPTDLSEKIPHFDSLIVGAQAIGGSVCLIFLYKRLLTAMRDMSTEEDNPNFAEIIGSTAVSAGLIASLPLFVERFLLPISNQIVKWIGNFPIDFEVVDAGLLEEMAPGTGLATAAFHVLFVAVIWGLGFFGLALAGMLRIAHLTIALIVGPIIMATYTNRSGILQTYFTELIAIVFTQPLHMLCYALVIWLTSTGSFESMLLSLAFIVVGIAGPSVIKRYIHSTGTAGAATGAGKFILYRAMMRR